MYGYDLENLLRLNDLMIQFLSFCSICDPLDLDNILSPFGQAYNALFISLEGDLPSTVLECASDQLKSLVSFFYSIFHLSSNKIVHWCHTGELWGPFIS